MKKTTHAAHHVQELTGQDRPGEVLVTPCPHCGTPMPRTALTAHVVPCSKKQDVPVDSGVAGGDGFQHDGTSH